jgi:hypothetical protein
MLRVRVRGDGWIGGPSLNTIYFRGVTVEGLAEATGAVVRVHEAFTAIAGLYPTAVTHTVLSEVDVIDPATGDVTATLTPADQAVVPGGSVTSAILPPEVALLLQIKTNTFIAGRRIRGRGFFSPITQSASVDTNGSPTAAMLTTLGLFTPVMAPGGPGGLNWVVWRRPKFDRTGPTPVIVRPGSTADVTATAVPDKYAVLRSRRD